jgi:hypothetical protein
MSKVNHPLLDMCLGLSRPNQPEMQKLVAGRVDLLRQPTDGNMRCGVDPLGAQRVARHDPRHDPRLKQRELSAKELDRQAREMWITHPSLSNTWLHVWVSPAVHEVARELEIFLCLEPSRRDTQTILAIAQRISDLRMLGVVIVSVWVANHRQKSGPQVVQYDLLSGISTSPPANGVNVMEFSAELARLFASNKAHLAVLSAIDGRASAQRHRAEKKLATATAALTASRPATPLENGTSAAV